VPYPSDHHLQKVVNVVRTFEDTLYAGTMKGLFSFHDGGFRESPEHPLLKNAQVRDVGMGPDGTLWVITKDRVITLSGQHVTDQTGSLSGVVKSFWGLGFFHGIPVVATNGKGAFRLQNGFWQPLDEALNSRFPRLIGMNPTAAGFLFFSNQEVIQWDGTRWDVVFDGGVEIWDAWRDGSGDLWVNTSAGIALQSDQSVRFFNRQQGLAANEFNMKSIFKDGLGEWWFGGIGGLVRFDPSYGPSTEPPPPLFFTSVQADEGQ
jgi:ligand-binding sensor domain-containing protein